jgi:ubiquinone/menaquinone biosynthesis C-methylase UbiE
VSQTDSQASRDSKRFYDESHGRLGSSGKVSFPEAFENEVEFKTLISMSKPNDWLLDCGCGKGRIASFLASANRRVIGVDISIQAIKRAIEQDRANCDFLVADVFSLPFRGQTFDGCFYVGTFEFVKDLEGSLKASYRVTKNGGWVMFEVWNTIGARIRRFLIPRRRRRRVQWHDTKTTMIAGERAGYRNLQMGGSFFLLPRDLQFLCTLALAFGANPNVIVEDALKVNSSAISSRLIKHVCPVTRFVGMRLETLEPGLS